MNEDSQFLLLLLGGFLTSILASITGFGGSTLLLPLSVVLVGFDRAVPMLGIASLIGNSSRVWLNRHQISLPITKWFSIGCVPAAIAGGVVFATTPTDFLVRPMGLLLLGIVVWRHIPRQRLNPIPAEQFTLIGGGFGFLSALVGGVGPFLAPFFLAAGLTRGAYVGTEACTAVILHLTKTATYSGMSVLSLELLGLGCGLGCIMILGSWVGKRIVDTLSEKFFVATIECLLVLIGLQFLLLG